MKLFNYLKTNVSRKQFYNQPPNTKNGQTLRVTEIFLSIQGESTHAGRPCAFVRLTGCPMRCVWCDSEYTFTGGTRRSFEEILSQLKEFGCNLVEVTGGEPLAQKAAFSFITKLCDEGFEVLIETGGFVSTKQVDERATLILDVKCPASGEAERNHWANLERLRKEKDEVKFVIADLEDWEFAKEIIAEYDLENRTRAVLISPVFEVENLAEIAETVSRSGLKVRLNLQLHKYIWGKDTRGV
ncbi:MAG: radical SAM protein [Acidobacteriota bacterium]|nr:radical SAM protein [Acidobacteriota bacterium]